MTGIEPRSTTRAPGPWWVIYLLEAIVALGIGAVLVLTVWWPAVADHRVVAQVVTTWHVATTAVPEWISPHPAALAVLLGAITAFEVLEADVRTVRAATDWDPGRWRYYFAIVFSHSVVDILWLPPPAVPIRRPHLVVVLVAGVTPLGIYLIQRYWHVGLGPVT